MSNFVNKLIPMAFIFTVGCSTNSTPKNNPSVDYYNQTKFKEKARTCVSGSCLNGVGIYNEYGYIGTKAILIRKYEGEFKDGKKHGKGRLTIFTRWYIAKGSYIKGRYHPLYVEGKPRPARITIGTWNKEKPNGYAINLDDYDVKNKKFRHLFIAEFTGNMNRKISLREVIATGVSLERAKKAIKELSDREKARRKAVLDEIKKRKQAVIDKENARKKAAADKEKAKKQAIIDKENARKKALKDKKNTKNARKTIKPGFNTANKQQRGCKAQGILSISISSFGVKNSYFKISPPSSVNIVNNKPILLKSLGVSREINTFGNGCIRGNYNFEYLNKRYRHRGSFYIDGKNSIYNILVSDNNMGAPYISIEGWY